MPAEDPSDGKGLVRKLVDRIINEWNTDELDSVFTPMAQLGPDRSSPPSRRRLADGREQTGEAPGEVLRAERQAPGPHPPLAPQNGKARLAAKRATGPRMWTIAGRLCRPPEVSPVLPYCCRLLEPATGDTAADRKADGVTSFHLMQRQTFE